MFYNKNNLVVSEFCGGDETKQELTGVLCLPNGSVATDSYVLLEVKNDERLYKNLEVPTIPTCENEQVFINMPRTGFIIPKQDVKEMEKYLNSRKNKTLPFMGWCWISNKSNQNIVKMLATDLSSPKIQVSQAIQGKYPDYKQIMPPDTDLEANYVKTTLNASYLKKMATAFDKMLEKDKNDLTIYVNKKDPNKPVIFRRQISGQVMTGVIMPIKQ